jgi:hypothetical protein
MLPHSAGTGPLRLVLSRYLQGAGTARQLGTLPVIKALVAVLITKLQQKRKQQCPGQGTSWMCLWMVQECLLPCLAAGRLRVATITQLVAWIHCASTPNKEPAVGAARAHSLASKQQGALTCTSCWSWRPTRVAACHSACYCRGTCRS